MTPEAKLQELGIELPEARSVSPGHGAWRDHRQPALPLRRHPSRSADGQPWNGRVGETYTVEEGYQAARLCAIQQLAQAKAVLGDLSRITGWSRCWGWSTAFPASGRRRRSCTASRSCSYEVFGERGVHARSAVGLQALPSNVPIEVETIFEIDRRTESRRRVVGEKTNRLTHK